MKMPILLCLLTVLSASIALRAMAVPTEAGGNLTTAARTSINKGLDWLKTSQHDDGHWSNANYPAMTALPLWAFARSDHPDAGSICSRAAEFITSFAQDNGGIYKVPTGGRGSGGLSTYNTAMCMTALYAYDKKKYADLILKARKFVADSQIQGDSPGVGGFGYGHEPGPRNRADLSNTGWSLMAMRYTRDLEDLRPSGQARVTVDWSSAIEYVQKLQNGDKDDPDNYGGFGYERGSARGGTVARGDDGAVKLRGYGSMTYAGLESMIYAQVDRNDPRVQSAVKWAARHWSVDVNPGMGRKGLFYYYNVMSKAFDAADIEALPRPAGAPPIDWKEDLIQKLSDLQKPDGSWLNTDNQFWESDPVLVTSYSVLALQNTLD
ncbi:MAG: prenyltransferase/squalene oxidase repeat-containing protein [Kiritimatiellia bacterium]